MKICLVASSGGHLMQLFSLRSFWQNYERIWVSFEREEAKSLLEGETVIGAYHPTNRNLVNFLRNLWLAWVLLRRERPQAVLSTGAGVAVPFLLVGRILGMKTVYIESLARIHDLSLSGKLVYFFVHHFFVQWEELTKCYPRAVYGGRVL